METETVSTIRKDNMFTTLVDKIIIELKSGIRHGFFKYEIKGEKLQASGKCAITLEAGKCHKYYILPEDLKEL